MGSYDEPTTITGLDGGPGRRTPRWFPSPCAPRAASCEPDVAVSELPRDFRAEIGRLVRCGEVRFAHDRLWCTAVVQLDRHLGWDKRLGEECDERLEQRLTDLRCEWDAAELRQRERASARREGRHLIVCERGDGDFLTISAALKAAPAYSTIEVHAGTYRERLRIRKPVRIVGDGQVSIEPPFGDDGGPTAVPLVTISFSEMTRMMYAEHGDGGPDVELFRLNLGPEIGTRSKATLWINARDNAPLRVEVVDCTIHGGRGRNQPVIGVLGRHTSLHLERTTVCQGEHGLVILDGAAQLWHCRFHRLREAAIWGAGLYLSLVRCELETCRNGIVVESGMLNVTMVVFRDISGNGIHCARGVDRLIDRGRFVNVGGAPIVADPTHSTPRTRNCEFENVALAHQLRYQRRRPLVCEKKRPRFLGRRPLPPRAFD